MFHYNMVTPGITLTVCIGLTPVCLGPYFYIYFLCFFLSCLFNMSLFLSRGGGAFCLKVKWNNIPYIYEYISVIIPSSLYNYPTIKRLQHVCGVATHMLKCMCLALFRPNHKTQAGTAAPEGLNKPKGEAIKY